MQTSQENVIMATISKIQSSLDELKEKVKGLNLDKGNGKTSSDSYSEGYDEGYDEGYADAKAELEKNESNLHQRNTKKFKTEATLGEYTKLICDKASIKDKLTNCRNRIDIYYEGGSSKGWRDSCTVMNLQGEGLVKVYYYRHTGHKFVRTFNLNKIKMIRNNEMEAIEALKSYEDFHNMAEGTATIQEVENSSAGVSGWMNSYGIVVQDDLVEKFQNLEFNLGKMSSASKTNGKKRRP
jgi:hypothetical protein